MDDIEHWYGVRLKGELPEGGIVGLVEVVDCVRDHRSKWAQRGHWHFVLRNSRPLPFVRWRGVQSLQTPTPALLKQLGL